MFIPDASRPGHRRDRDGGPRVGHGELDCAVGRRRHELHRDPVHRLHGPGGDNRDRRSAGDERDHQRPDRRHGLHVHRPGHQHQRQRPGLGAIQLGDADRPHRALGADGSDGQPGHSQAQVSWTAPNDNGSADHRLHDHPVHRHHGPDAGAGQQRLGHLGQRQRPDQRDRLHLHGGGDQRGRDRRRLHGIQPRSRPNDTLFDFAHPARWPMPETRRPWRSASSSRVGSRAR